MMDPQFGMRNCGPASSFFALDSESKPRAKANISHGKFTISPPTQLVPQELESPNGPFEMCNTEPGGNGSPSCQSPKPAWDMDTLKQNICSARAGTGDVRTIIETCTFKPREQAFTTLINMCGQLRDWKKAVEVFEAMQTVRGVKSNMYTYSALIAACSSAGEWVKALDIFEQMKEAARTDRNCTPNEFTYSSLITACERGGQYAKALEVYDEMLANNVPGDHITYSSVLTACEKSRNWARAEILLAEMHSRGLTGNAVIYSELLLYYTEREDWSKALSMILQMQTAGQEAVDTASKKPKNRGKTKNNEPGNSNHLMNAGNYIQSSVSSSTSMTASPKVTPRTLPSPDVESQGTLTPRPLSVIGTSSAATNTATAISMGTIVPSYPPATPVTAHSTSNRPPWDMETLKRAICFAKTGTGEVKKAFETCTFRPREQAFTALINMCGRLRDWRKALEVFEAMDCIKGVTPNTYIYSALIAACSSSGEWEKALGIFENMKAKAKVDQNCIPNEVTYSALITACQRGGMFDRALELYYEMIQSGVKPDQITYSSVLAACEKSERWETVEEILDSMHAQGLCGPQTIYSELILHYADYGAYEKALQVHMAVQMLGHQPDEKMKKALIKALEKSEKYEIMLEVFKDIQKCGKAIDPEIINSVIHAQERVNQKLASHHHQQQQQQQQSISSANRVYTNGQFKVRRNMSGALSNQSMFTPNHTLNLPQHMETMYNPMTGGAFRAFNLQASSNFTNNYSGRGRY